jgi:protein-tyrosine phosphatase
MPKVLTWQGHADQRPTIRQAVRALADGQLVAFPTETVYGIAASVLRPDAVERLALSKDRPDDKPLTLAISDAAEALDWVPGLSALGRRLTRRCWPGPVTLVSSEGVANGLVGRLSESVRHRVCPSGTVGLRTPAHAAILQVLRRLPGPLVLTSANRGGAAEALTADEVVAAVGEHVALVIADGPSRYGRASTVVRVHASSWTVLREGVVPEATLRRLIGIVIVFVCTGNTCRSPLAEVLFKKLLAERLGCSPDELPQRGYVVLSAGLAAAKGGTAAPEAIEVARELGADLEMHSSRPLTPELATQADYLVAMTQGHLRLLTDQFPDLATRPRLLASEGQDVPDPIGYDQQTYRDCAQVIRAHLEKLLPEVDQR